VIASDDQLRDSAIHIHVSIFPQTLFSSRLPHNIEHCSMCYTVDPCWLSILDIDVNKNTDQMEEDKNLSDLKRKRNTSSSGVRHISH